MRDIGRPYLISLEGKIRWKSWSIIQYTEKTYSMIKVVEGNGQKSAGVVVQMKQKSESGFNVDSGGTTKPEDWLSPQTRISARSEWDRRRLMLVQKSVGSFVLEPVQWRLVSLPQPQDDYSVLFEDTSYADGYSPPLNVAQRYVVACKENKKKWRLLDTCCSVWNNVWFICK